MREAVEGLLSKPREVLRGVSQGSVLVHCFTYIKHIATNLSSEYNLLAGDMKISPCLHYSPSSGDLISAAILQSDIDRLHRATIHLALTDHTSFSWGLPK